MLPFWAPDSRRIGFFADGKLKTVDVGSGAVRILCEAPLGRNGGTWSRDGVIVFAPSLTGPLYRISESGGVPVPVTRMSREGSGQSHRWPLFLPDGKRFLYFVDWSAPDDLQGNGIYVGSLDASAPKLVSSELAGNVAFATGHLLYGRDRSLRVQPFDPDRLQLSGTVVSIAEQELEEDPRDAQRRAEPDLGSITRPFDSPGPARSDRKALASSAAPASRTWICRFRNLSGSPNPNGSSFESRPSTSPIRRSLTRLT
jgi:hypothetical protein